MYGEDEFTLAGTSTERPDQWPESTEVVTIFEGASTFDHEKNGEKLRKLSLKFTIGPEAAPPWNGRSKDQVFTISGATENNKYWMQQFFLKMQVPATIIQSWKGLGQIVTGLNQIKGRKYVMKARANGDYQNIVVDSVRPYVTQQQYQQIPGGTIPVTAPTQATAPAVPPPPPAPVQVPTVNPTVNPQNGNAQPSVPSDPWEQFRPPETQQPQVNTGVPNDPWTNQPTPVVSTPPAVTQTVTDPNAARIAELEAQLASAQQNQPPTQTTAQAVDAEDEAKQFLQSLENAPEQNLMSGL